VSQMEISVESMKARTSSQASTVEMDVDSVKSEANLKLQKTAITTEMDDLAIVSKTAPATPIRRSRRLSGATPAPSYTPSLLRSRRASGTTTTPAKKFDELELRNRTVVETLSLVSDFGQEEVPDDQNKFDTLELRNRTVTETLSLTKNFGVSEKEEVTKVTEVPDNQQKFDTLELRNRVVTETLSLTENFGVNEEVTHVTPEKDSNKVSQPTSRRNRSTTPDSSPEKASKSEKLSLDIKSKASDESASSPKESPVARTRRQSKREIGGLFKDSPVKRSTRTTKKELSSPLAAVEVETAPTTPSKVTALPKHITPLKKIVTPRKEELPFTPTRRSRRLSSGDLGSEPPTPTRKSRRLSGAADLESAPDGGLITGGTPRKTPMTPRRHTSVRPEDVDSALAIAGGVAPLPTLVEEDEKDITEEKIEMEVEAPPISKRGRKSIKPPSNPSLNVISEEEVPHLPDETVDESPIFPMKSRPKRKEEDQLPEGPPPKRRSRRVTITTLGTDVDLFTPVKATPASTSGTSRRESTGQAGTKKKYVPVKRKTSVRIK